jgi:histidinol-phosphate aminotransferase
MSRGPATPDYIRNLAVYTPGKPIEEVRRELGFADEIIKLASNENAWGSSPKAIAAIQAALPEIHRYPDGGGYYLRKAIAECTGVPVDAVILGNGSTEIIEMLAKAYLADGDEAVFSQQSFVMYPIAIASVNGRGIAVPATTDRRHDVDAIARAVTPRTKLIFIANPSNPTGTYMTRAEMDRLLDDLSDDVLLVVDQAYFEYVGAADYPDALDDLRAGRNVIVLRTFSKIYGLAGVRIGYGFAHPEVIATLNRVRSPFNTSQLAQIAGLAALHDTEWADRCSKENAKELSFLESELAKREVGFTKSVANFVLVDFGADAQTIVKEFEKRGVIIRPVGGPGLAGCGRVSVGTRRENERFLAVLDQIMAKPV